MTFTKILKTSVVTVVALIALGAGQAAAAGASSVALSASGNDVNVTVTGTDLTTVTASITYDASKLSCSSSSIYAGANLTSAFGSCGGGSASITSYIAPGSPAVSGTLSAGGIHFTPLSPGTAALSTTSSTLVPKNGANDWNAVISSTSITILAGGSGSGSTGSTSSSTVGSSKTTTSTTKKAVATVATGSTNGSSNTSAGAAAAATVTTDSNGNVKAASVTTIKKTEAAETAVPTQSNTAAWILAGLLIAGLAILAFLRREQLGAFAASTRNKFASKPAAKAAKPAATSVTSKTTAQRISKK